MGSSFSIKNDTPTNIYVWNGVQWDYVLLGLSGGLAVVAAPVAAAAAGAAAGAGAGAAAIAASEVASVASAGAGAGAAAGAGAGSGAGATVAATAIAAAEVGTSVISVTTSNQEQRNLNAINTFKKECDRKLAPGEVYTYSGSLSLTRSVYLMREDGQTSSRGCWTGPTDNSDIRYNVSRDWDW